jgi:hypothetical protein
MAQGHMCPSHHKPPSEIRPFSAKAVDAALRLWHLWGFFAKDVSA